MPLQGPPILAGSKTSSSRKTQKKEKAKLKTAKDRGPLGEGAKLDYAIADDGAENACDEGQPFREGPHSGGTSLQLQLQEYALKMAAKEGGGAHDSRTRQQDATNWMLTVMGPKQAPAQDAHPGHRPRRDRSRSTQWMS